MTLKQALKYPPVDTLWTREDRLRVSQGRSIGTPTNRAASPKRTYERLLEPARKSKTVLILSLKQGDIEQVRL